MNRLGGCFLALFFAFVMLLVGFFVGKSYQGKQPYGSDGCNCTQCDCGSSGYCDCTNCDCTMCDCGKTGVCTCGKGSGTCPECARKGQQTATFQNHVDVGVLISMVQETDHAKMDVRLLGKDTTFITDARTRYSLNDAPMKLADLLKNIKHGQLAKVVSRNQHVVAVEVLQLTEPAAAK